MRRARPCPRCLPSAVAGLLLVAAACGQNATDKLRSLELDDAGKAALGRLRFGRLHPGDHLLAGDLLVCGGGDRVLLGFSRPLVEGFLGRDSEWLIPELFTASSATEVFLEVPEGQVMRLALPRGIGSTGLPPEAWVRELKGSPLFSSDARAVIRLFSDGEQEELFARRDNPAAPGELMQHQAAEPSPPPVAAASPAGASPARTPSLAAAGPILPSALPPGATWRLGVAVFPRMGAQRGVVIASVVAGSPAATAGLEPGDRILSVGGLNVTTFQELKRRVAESRGATLQLEVVRRTHGGAAVSEAVAVPLPAR